MLQIHMIFTNDIIHDGFEDVFDLSFYLFIDEIAERPITWLFVIHEVHILDIDFALPLHIPQRCIPDVHEAEQDCFQHVDPIEPWPAQMPWIGIWPQVLFDSDLLHDLVKCQYRIADVQNICDVYW